MSDWTTQPDCLQAIQYGYEDAEFINELLLVPAYNDAYAGYVAYDNRVAISYLLSCISYQIQINRELYKAHDTEGYTYALPYYLDKYTGVTIDKMIEAMWDTDKLRSFHFINYIDSMRAGIWNVQIYEKHLEEWYRHFST